ncbi:hypothetical protein G6F22_021895 [Rhizopus arrhizus]|nr:hypothetical protein G6F22_021895 [Rhizopus arrhizus]
MGDIPTVAHAPGRDLPVPVRHESLVITARILLRQALDQRREHQPRHDRIHAHAVLGVDDRRRRGHLHQGRLGRRIAHLGFARIPQPGNR